MGDPLQSLHVPSGSVIRESSTPRDAGISPVRLKELRALKYAAYLQTPEWKATRNAKLRATWWHCERCQKRANLQVHHQTYDRLGAELDTDLEVLCRVCHEGHHHEEDRSSNLGVYLKLITEALRTAKFTSMADLSETVKIVCAKLKIKYDGDRIARSLQIITGSQPGVFTKEPLALGNPSLPPGTPISHGEAIQIMRKLGIKIGLLDMPTGARLSPEAIEVQRQVLLEEVRPTAAWERATEERHCGWCNATIAEGSSRLVVKSKKWTRERCEPCAAKLGLGPKPLTLGPPGPPVEPS